MQLPLLCLLWRRGRRRRSSVQDNVLWLFLRLRPAEDGVKKRKGGKEEDREKVWGF